MKAYHNSRSIAHRAPYGCIEPGTAVRLALDVWSAPGTSVTLRTWVDGRGEEVYEMRPLTCAPERPGEVGADGNSAPRPKEAEREASCAEPPVRFQVEIAPEESGIVWYYFIITDTGGNTRRYGAKDGRYGGEGQMRDWEPPSFQLTACAGDDGRAREAGDAILDAVIGYLCGKRTAHELAETFETVRENHPATALRQAFSLLGSHDLQRLTRCLDEEHRGLAKGRLWCLGLVQLLMAEHPKLHLEDPVDVDGIEDPIDYSAAPWNCDDDDYEAIVNNTIDLRRSLPLFAQGRTSCFAANDDVFAFWRDGEDGTRACVLVNASLRDAHDVPVPMAGEAVSEVIGGYDAPVMTADELGAAGLRGAGGPDAEGEPDTAGGRYAVVHLYQLGSAVLYFHPAPLLGKPLEPGLGVLAHITSLPAKSQDPGRPAGTLGAPARAFVDWLAKAGVRYWQVLPVNPTDEYGSPYAGISAFAGNVRLLEAADTADDDETSSLGQPRCGRLSPADSEEYRAFREHEGDWLEPYAAFMAIREMMGDGLAWQDWPRKYRSFDPAVLGEDRRLERAAERWRRAQFAFHRQWGELRSYANEHGVRIVGDMPIYVSGDSSDVWANQHIFQLGPDGKPEVVAGCPPDAFAVEGQIWGNPVYDWDALAADGYGWWMRRLRRAFELYDVVRLDHFIGFSRYFSIPSGEKATAGTYRPGPGLALFHRAQEEFGPLPILAEDLGAITPAVRALVASCGFPGMDIVQFVDGGDPLSGYTPRPGKVAYTGTHDNQTLVGYCEKRYPGSNARETADTLVKAVVTCKAPVAVLPLQDVLGLGDEARMNVPGVAEGNWAWHAEAADVQQALPRLAELAELHRSR